MADNEPVQLLDVAAESNANNKDPNEPTSKARRKDTANLMRFCRRLYKEAYSLGGRRSLSGAAHIWLGVRAWMNTAAPISGEIPKKALDIEGETWADLMQAPAATFAAIAMKLQMLEYKVALEDEDGATRLVGILGAIRASIPDDMTLRNRHEAERLLARAAHPTGSADHA